MTTSPPLPPASSAPASFSCSFFAFFLLFADSFVFEAFPIATLSDFASAIAPSTSSTPSPPTATVFTKLCFNLLFSSCSVVLVGRDFFFDACNDVGDGTGSSPPPSPATAFSVSTAGGAFSANFCSFRASKLARFFAPSTFITRPCSLVPFISYTARTASSSSANCTKPNPLWCVVSWMAPGAARFFTKNACFTGPIAEKVDERMSSVTAASRPRTKTVRESCDGDADSVMQNSDGRATPARHSDAMGGV